MSTLYDLKGEFLALYELAADEENEQAFLDTLDSLKSELAVKAGGYAHVIKQLEMEAFQCQVVAKEFAAKKSLRENHIKRMKDALIDAMDVAEVTSIPADEYDIKIVGNGGVKPLKITGTVPDNFMKVKFEPDNDKIRKALNAGEKLDFAHLEERGRRLEIK